MRQPIVVGTSVRLTGRHFISVKKAPPDAKNQRPQPNDAKFVMHVMCETKMAVKLKVGRYSIYLQILSFRAQTTCRELFRDIYITQF